MPAGLLLLGVLGAGGVAWLGAVRRRRIAEAPLDLPPGTLAVLTTAVLGASVLGLVDGVLVMPVSQELAVLTAGMALGLYRSGLPALAPLGRTGVRAWGLIMALAAVVAVGAMFPDVLHLPERQDRLGEVLAQRYGQPNNRFPRFWQMGALVE